MKTPNWSGLSWKRLWMSDFIVPNIICFWSQKKLITLNSIGILLKGVLIDLCAHNFMHVETSLCTYYLHAHHHVWNLLISFNNDCNKILKTIIKVVNPTKAECQAKSIWIFKFCISKSPIFYWGANNRAWESYVSSEISLNVFLMFFFPLYIYTLFKRF